MIVDIQQIVQIAKDAGKKILEVYNDEKLFNVVDFKADDSPLTLADQKANDLIEGELIQAYPDIPILSEEGRAISFEERKSWDTFWLVDPLDGTKEFIKRNGEFTVNIALIQDGHPILGVIYVPVTGTLYYGDVTVKQAFKRVSNDPSEVLKVNNKSNKRIAVQSRSHSSDEENSLLKSYGVTDSISVGSSLKFCMVAEGKADIYYRHGPTMEWDTGAGQAVLEAAGGRVVRKKDGQRFYYNKQNLLNESFICFGF